MSVTLTPQERDSTDPSPSRIRMGDAGTEGGATLSIAALLATMAGTPARVSRP